ncbi:MAG TPA: hypothetical protein VES19_06545 [Candidatus Limnocylindrales bacterium]|nr:hypothetical protein [Candidatus Limnocylindrales bacterium]
MQLLDPISIVGAFAIFAIVSLLAFEGGYRVGLWWQKRTPDEKEGPTGMLVGSLLALLAFLLAVTMGMASDRFDTRRQLVLQEANAIGTTYLRAGYLPAPYADEMRDLLREYVPLRINVADRDRFVANQARSSAIQAEMWAMTEELARSTPDSDVLALFISTLNDTIDLQASRVTAIVTARVPQTILLLLFVGEALTMAMVGYSAGLTRRRSVLTALVLVLVLGAVLTVVVDLDRPRDGYLQVSQQPLIDLGNQIGAQEPAP